MKSISGKRLVKLLEKHNWKLIRIKGSHHVYMKEGNQAKLSIPIHGNQDLKVGLLKHFMKIAGINENEL